jgi:16S rRNA (guanine527-N7)-methyltransferase
VSDVAGYLQDKAQRALGRRLRAAETASMGKYLNLLIKWQKSQRLIGSSDPNWIVDNVIVDSLLFTQAIPRELSTLCDLGSGAGIPGIPLSVVMPSIHVTLIEARQRRGSFLSTVIRELGLHNCTLLNRRLEDVVPELRGRFNAVVMRCAGSPASLLTKVRHVIAPGGVVIASGPPKRQEIPFGNWLEVEGPAGVRRFWVYHVT